MLPKKKRVTKNIFQSTMKGGKSFSTKLFLFYYTQNNNPQYAFVAPKVIFKNAVKRNKYRRIGYNILRSIPIKPSIGLFIYKKQAILATQQEIKEETIFILKKTGLID
jgi:ribonuclease P protein component